MGTALKTAIKHGIKPDFVVAIETSIYTKSQIDVPELANFNIIAGNAVYSEIFKLKAKRFFNYYGNKTPASKWLGEIFGVPVKNYTEAGTVSLTALYSAKILGCTKIIFIGQDLAYTDNRCYSKDSVYGGYKLDDSNNIMLTDKEETKSALNTDDVTLDGQTNMLGRDMIQVRGLNGNPVTTRPDFLMFIKYFEKIAKEFGSELTLVNATEGGAFLEGYEHITLKEALEKYSAKNSIDVEKILAKFEIKNTDIEKRKRIVLPILNEIIKNYDAIFEIENQYVIESFNPCFDGKINFSGDWQKELRENIEHLFRESLDIFIKNFNSAKEFYLKINYLAEQNIHLKNCLIEDLLKINNKLANFEDQDENLINLSVEMNIFHVKIYNCCSPLKNLILTKINEIQT